MCWALDEFKKMSEIPPEVINRLLSEIRRSDPGVYKSIVVGAYVDGKINLNKAAELLGVTRIEIQRVLREKGVSIRVPSKEDARAETVKL